MLKHAWGPIVRGTSTIAMPGRTFVIEVDRRTCATCGTVEVSYADCGFEEGSSSDACWIVRPCVRCGHEPCEACGIWCDVMVRVDGESEMCCDGRCLYPGDQAPAGTEGLEAEERRAAAEMGVSVHALYVTHRAVPCLCDEEACSGWRIEPRPSVREP